MINAPITARPDAATADVTAIDTTARGPLLFLLGSALSWLLISGVLGVITSIQLHTPHFLADCPWLTYGRAQAMAESSFVYGWAANAGIAIVLWVLGRLSGTPLRGLNWVLFGGVFWNLGVTLGLIGIAMGDMTSFALLELPRYVQVLLVFSWATMSVAGVLAWTGRRTELTYASHWYGVAALFLFPWLLSAAQVILLWSPLRGALQAVAAGWYAQGAWTLWLAPLALCAAYYIVPKVTGRTLPSYEFAALGFWTLVFIGGWTGGRHLIGGPLPAWIATMAIVTCSLLLFHYFVLVLNLRIVVGGGGMAIKFIRFGLGAYVLGGVLDALTAFRGIAVETQFTLFTTAQEQLALYGAVTMIFFGAIYFMLPRLTGRPWASSGLAVSHRLLVKVGLVLLLVTLAVGGWTQGVDLLNAKAVFPDILGHLNLCLLGATVAQVVLLLGNLLLFVNFCRSTAASALALVPMQAFFRPTATVEGVAR